jgi:hypothetical protein
MALLRKAKGYVESFVFRPPGPRHGPPTPLARFGRRNWALTHPHKFVENLLKNLLQMGKFCVTFLLRVMILAPHKEWAAKLE